MAIVKPTHNEWLHVERQIGEMFRKRLDYAQNWANYGHAVAELEQLMLDEAYPPNIRKQIQECGETFFNKHERLSVLIGGTLTYLICFPPMYVPEKLCQYGNATKIKNAVVMEVAKKRTEAIRKVEKEREDFKNMVKKLWEDAPSLNAIAKVWHPIMELLSEGVKERMNTKVERRNLSKTVDTAALQDLSVGYLKSKVGK